MSYGTALYRQTVSHAAYLGDSGIGELWDTPADLRCRITLQKKVLRSAQGDQIVADAVLVCRPSEIVREKDRITHGTTVFQVAEVRPAQGPHTAVNHLEVMLRAD